MTNKQYILEAFSHFDCNELIFASRAYKQCCNDTVKETTYYKTLERLCNENELVKIAKGIYYKPKLSRYGVVPPSEHEIVSAFTEDNTGVVVGYTLYNSINITTQVSKNIDVYSSGIEQQTKSIRNVSLHRYMLNYDDGIKNLIQLLEVLKNFDTIEDINYRLFIKYCENAVKKYSDESAEQVLSHIKYSKRTISFLKEILDYYYIPNRLSSHLSTLSKYQHPRMEDLYELAQ